MELFNYPITVLMTIAGFSLIFLEALIPGGVFMVLGVTLFIAGVVGLVIPALGTPVGLLLTMIIIAPLTYLVYSRLELYTGDDTDVRETSSVSSLEGASGRVIDTVTPDGGRVKLDNGGMNPNYHAQSQGGAIEEGTDIVVVDPGGGNQLIVEPATDEDPT